ncbi:MAG TPA: hypothetical protein VGH27_09180 [Streptosporangiaceae bacterium]|jgi:hypothetical protein
MAPVIWSLIAAIIGCYLLRWGNMYVIKRQRIDIASELKRMQHEVTQGLRMSRRLTRWLCKLSK